MTRDDLHVRIARALGWSVKDVYSTSMHSLRDLVRRIDDDLAHEITAHIRSGAYIVAHPTPALTSRGRSRK